MDKVEFQITRLKNDAFHCLIFLSSDPNLSRMKEPFCTFTATKSWTAKYYSTAYPLPLFKQISSDTPIKLFLLIFLASIPYHDLDDPLEWMI